jgi:hypothetical protein
MTNNTDSSKGGRLGGLAHAVNAKSLGETKSVSAVPSKRNAFEQQEFQRKNPWLFTTPTQQVLPDGRLLTYQEVTAKLQEQKDKLVAMARVVAARYKFNTDYWFMLTQNSNTKDMVDYLDAEMKKCHQGFITNYQHMYERWERLLGDKVNDLLTEDGHNAVSGDLEAQP